MVIIYLILEVLGVIFLFLKKKSIGITLVSIASLLLAISLINTATQTRNIKLSDDFLNQISAINWEDESELLNLGFKKQGDEYIIFTADENLSGVAVTKKAAPTNCEKYKDIQYTATQTGFGALEIKRLWKDEISVVRRYNVYVNGMEIYAREDNFEGEKSAFENFINYIGVK